MKLSIVLAAVLGPWLVQGACSKYYIMDARGTGEMQGPSIAFSSANSQILAAVPGGTSYHVVYPAGFMQDSSQGTSDIVNKVKSYLQQDPSACFVLEGYSQGAMAVNNALSKMTDPKTSNAIVAVMLVGNPAHTGGLETMMAPNVGQWKSKILDLCAAGDNVCGMATAGTQGASHISYGMTPATQTQLANFAKEALSKGSGSSATSVSTESCPQSDTSANKSGKSPSATSIWKRLFMGTNGLNYDSSGSKGWGGLGKLGGFGGGNAGTSSSSPSSTSTNGCGNTPAPSSNGKSSAKQSLLKRLFSSSTLSKRNPPVKRSMSISQIKRLAPGGMGGMPDFSSLMSGASNPLSSMMGGGSSAGASNPLSSMMGGGSSGASNPLSSIMGGGSSNPLSSLTKGGGSSGLPSLSSLSSLGSGSGGSNPLSSIMGGGSSGSSALSALSGITGKTSGSAGGTSNTSVSDATSPTSTTASTGLQGGTAATAGTGGDTVQPAAASVPTTSTATKRNALVSIFKRLASGSMGSMPDFSSLMSGASNPFSSLMGGESSSTDTASGTTTSTTPSTTTGGSTSNPLSALEGGGVSIPGMPSLPSLSSMSSMMPGLSGITRREKYEIENTNAEHDKTFEKMESNEGEKGDAIVNKQPHDKAQQERVEFAAKGKDDVNGGSLGKEETHFHKRNYRSHHKRAVEIEKKGGMVRKRNKQPSAMS